MIFRSPLSKLQYYYNKRLQVRNPKYLTNLQLNPYPNTQSDLFCSNSFPFWCTAPKYVANGYADPSTRLQNTNLKRLLAAKFFSSSTRWRSGRWLVTKPYGANTQQLLQRKKRTRSRTLSPVTICLNRVCSLLEQSLMILHSLLDFLNRLEGFHTRSWNVVSWSS